MPNRTPATIHLRSTITKPNNKNPNIINNRVTKPPSPPPLVPLLAHAYPHVIITVVRAQRAKTRRQDKRREEGSSGRDDRANSSRGSLLSEARLAAINKQNWPTSRARSRGLAIFRPGALSGEREQRENEWQRKLQLRSAGRARFKGPAGGGEERRKRAAMAERRATTPLLFSRLTVERS